MKSEKQIEEGKEQAQEVQRELREADRNVEHGAPMAPHQNRPPAEQHRGGPLPNQKK